MSYLPTSVAMGSCIDYIVNKDLKPKEQGILFTLLGMLCTSGMMLHPPEGREHFCELLPSSVLPPKGRCAFQ